MSPGELDDTGWRGSVEGELIQQDETGSGIHLLLAGYVSLQPGTPLFQYLRQVGEYGYYWSSTVDESYTQSTAVYYRRIRFNSSQIERTSTTIEEKDYVQNVYKTFMSVRYVRDSQNN